MRSHYHIGELGTGRLFDALYSMKSYLEYLKKYFEPLVMKLVPTAFGVEVRGEAETDCFPPHYTKLGIYQDWCFLIGHIITFAKKFAARKTTKVSGSASYLMVMSGLRNLNNAM